MGRHDIAYRDPTGNQAVGRVMRAEAHADLGLGYPPDDDTEDLTSHVRGAAKDSRCREPISPIHEEPLTGSSRHHEELHGRDDRAADSKKPPTTSTAKHLVEGVQTTTQQEVDPS